MIRNTVLFGVFDLMLYDQFNNIGIKYDFVDHIFLEAQCLASILQHVSPLTMAELSCNSLLHTLPYKIFDN